jgi:hypothetical protein
MIDECGADGRMRICRGKVTAVPLFPSQIPHDPTCGETQTNMVELPELWHGHHLVKETL